MKRSDLSAAKLGGRRTRRFRLQGFAYLWLLLLVASMGLGLTIAAQIDATTARRDREKELLSIGRQFRDAIGRYYETQTTGARREYPGTLDDLLRDNRVPGIRRHLRQLAVDPMTRKAEWGLVMLGGRVAGVHSLSDKVPIKQDGFDPGDQAFRGKQSYAEWVFTYPADLTLQTAPGTGLKPESTGATASPALAPDGNGK